MKIPWWSNHKIGEQLDSCSEEVSSPLAVVLLFVLFEVRKKIHITQKRAKRILSCAVRRTIQRNVAEEKDTFQSCLYVYLLLYVIYNFCAPGMPDQR